MAVRRGLLVSTVVLVLFLGTAAAARKTKRIDRNCSKPNGILKPQSSESRIVKTLDGIWKFRVAPEEDCEIGFREEWFKTPLATTGEVEVMPVPSSYNDVTQRQELRDHVGWAWYEREFFVAAEWLDGKRRIFLRVGAANYYAIVYINSVQMTTHAGGYLPFIVEIDLAVLRGDTVNRITIAVDNRLTPNTIPQGKVTLADGKFVQKTAIDFFNYAGIYRPVVLYTTPRTYIDDIDVTTRVTGTTGHVKYSIKAYTDADETGCVMESSDVIEVKLEDKLGTVVAFARGATGELDVPNANLWWPYTMAKNNSMAGYQYTLVVTLTERSSGLRDVYRLKVGIRSIEWSSSGFFINGETFYFRGVGRHDDADIRGRAVDEATIIKDFNTMEWLGVNSYRTTHYPPSGTTLDVADELGIVVFEETAAVALSGYHSELLVGYKEQIREMIQRDKNRASIVMWSVGHEPDVTDPRASEFFKEIIEYTKELDYSRRPVTIINPSDVSCEKDLTMKHVDIISLNRFYGSYDNTGDLDVITKSVLTDVEDCAGMYKKPLLFAGYGIPAVTGLHRVPSFIFTEEYQADAMRMYFRAFDELRSCDRIPFIGEMFFAFADFMTKQQYWSADGNKAGVLTRQRQPKASAHLLRQRYFLLALKLSAFPLPTDLPSFLPVYGSRFLTQTTFEGKLIVD